MKAFVVSVLVYVGVFAAGWAAGHNRSRWLPQLKAAVARGWAKLKAKVWK